MGYEGVTSMVRLAILLVLLCLTLWEWIAGPRKAVYWLAMASLFVFFSLRYGQGTDYITYMSIYANVQPLHTLPNYFAYRYDTIEIGFYYLMSFFRMLRLPATATCEDVQELASIPGHWLSRTRFLGDVTLPE